MPLEVSQPNIFLYWLYRSMILKSCDGYCAFKVKADTCRWLTFYKCQLIYNNNRLARITVAQLVFTELLSSNVSLEAPQVSTINSQQPSTPHPMFASPMAHRWGKHWGGGGVLIVDSIRWMRHNYSLWMNYMHPSLQYKNCYSSWTREGKGSLKISYTL